jgi:hypothetical protein
VQQAASSAARADRPGRPEDRLHNRRGEDACPERRVGACPEGIDRACPEGADRACPEGADRAADAHLKRAAEAGCRGLDCSLEPCGLM